MTLVSNDSLTIDDADLRRRLPPVDATLRASVRASVEIIRDRAGVPHVYAASTADLYLGLGFAMAQDRLWQMDRLRRRALGRQAEILGPEYVQSDLLHRAVGIPEIAAREVERVDPATRHILDRFVAGINRHIEACGRDLPIEFALLDYAPEPFSVRDSIAILRGEFWSLNGRLYTLAIAEAAGQLPADLRAAYLAPEAPEHRILPPGVACPAVEPVSQSANSNQVLMGMGDGTGSNNWAIAASRTSSGHAMLGSDPHQPFWLPSSWYEYAVHGPEDDAAGAGHPGVPGLWFGANGSIAWGITNNAASTRDLYREQVHPTDPRLYRDGDTWREFEERIEEIPVRGQTSVRHVQQSTVRGPIVNHVVPAVNSGGDAPLSLRWVGQEHLDDMRATIAIGRATDWDTFRGALRDWSVPAFNFGYADKTGRVGYQCAGRVPIRGRLARGYRDANEPTDAWQGYIPFEALPHVVDPERGYVASANERVAPDDYPYALHGSFAAGHRAARLHQVLANSPSFDREQAIALQNDVKSCRAERLAPPLVEWLALADHPDVVVLREALAAWDYRYTTNSPAPTLFETFMHVWQARVARERFAHGSEQLIALVQASGGVAAQLIERGDDQLHWFTGDLRGEVAAAVRDALERVRTRHGSSPADWQWGKVHQAHWRHPLSPAGETSLDVGPASVDGGSDTLRNTGAGQPAFAAASGAEYRLIVDFAEPDRFLAVQNVGNSGQPGSPHYADQFDDWLTGKYHVVNLQRTEVERDAEGTTILQPRE
jgi:penicillin amidase